MESYAPPQEIVNRLISNLFFFVQNRRFWGHVTRMLQGCCYPKAKKYVEMK